MESSRFTKDQIEKLVQIMEQNPEVAKGVCSNPSAFWTDVAKELNPLGPSKDKTGWRNAWAYKKSNVKKKYTQMVRERNKTGGGIAPSVKFTDIEERILNVTNIKTNAEGIEDTICIGVPGRQQAEYQQEPQGFHLGELQNQEESQSGENQPNVARQEVQKGNRSKPRSNHLEELQPHQQEESQSGENQPNVARQEVQKGRANSNYQETIVNQNAEIVNQLTLLVDTIKIFVEGSLNFQQEILKHLKKE